MRTENQIKSKVNELTLQRRSLESRIAPLADQDSLRSSLLAQKERIEDMILMLEWVLNEPQGKYHA
ncbi:hypothetical protein KIH86_19490 [Paenibacillus sp. HN-1]|uniref:hypothetical protein n=1 Tax=Paenibacillus TaxID=44249 RepID=UPI001CA96FC4|nr:MULTISPECIES: hypothetical protein [Paenibacillus]MBY9082243.1 hypothetical protein [Paenibacillus sp. CGMCC 1.18879]MBY9086393.1 hypothetical protein [Paenibacillus sinensis]